MQIRRFSADLKSKVSGGHPGLYAVPVQLDSSQVKPDNLEALARRANGLPLLIDTPTIIVAMYFEPHATLEEHSAGHPIVFLVTAGRGQMRIGGPKGETRTVVPGDAILWPAHVDHMVWTEDETLEAIVVELPMERAEQP